MHLMTAAHKTLPFHSVVEVHNLDNDRRARVRITDRGPFVKGRIIDLSYEAAKRLQMTGTGLARVEIRVVDTIYDSVATPRAVASYTVQVGAFRDRRYAEELAARIKGQPAARIEQSGEWFRVRVGEFESEHKARDLRDRLGNKGHRAIVIRVPQ
jgi:rare lipoprotein A